MDDFEKLDKYFDDMIKKMPEKKKELLENVGEIFTTQAKENIDSRVNDDYNNIKNDLKIVYGSGGGYVALKPSYKNTKVHHLIENGHRIVKNGVVVGFVNGKHMYRDIPEQVGNEIYSMAQKMLNEVTK